MPEMRQTIHGCLLGTAVGDAMGLIVEGLSPARQRKLYPVLERPRLLPGRAMVSDDTEHACMVAQSLIVSAGEVSRFTQHLAHELRLWLLSGPPGIGWATLRATGKLCLGIPPTRSGVFSAGNGPAMRSALIGVCYGSDPERLLHLTRAATRITHTDPEAFHGAVVVAVAAHLNATGRLSPAFLRDTLASLSLDRADALLALIDRVLASVDQNQETREFAASLGLKRGVTGYVYHTVPVALHAVLRHCNDLRTAVLSAIHCGGDTDTTGAIAGAVAGAGTGPAGIPADWVCAIREWPRTVHWMEHLCERLAEVVVSETPGAALPWFRPAQVPRNALFLTAVLLHGIRRLLPPY
ncbi:MAG: ADP-ribosylglycohydrolase family protein [Chloroherpetonaceae bacterium]|nr:ADP-ribosylglycohydrolase family protein [Chthonomonadaceae bacterium]MDW8209203.1 ADP-ribosylglycohydrolase family protein [Chloroherpetonaceae bacterium]